jgi:uncharacterized protein (DUF1697 family)
MHVYIAFLRAINVGGKNALPMKSLIGILEGMGATKVQTYIQSGNAVFQSADKSATQLSSQLAAAIQHHHGFEPHILVLGLAALQKACAGNPFPEAEADPQSLHLGFLSSKPQRPDLEKLSSLKKPSERFSLGDGVFYLHAPQGVGKSKLAASAEKVLGVPMTDRNWRTVCKVLELAPA